MRYEKKKRLWMERIDRRRAPDPAWHLCLYPPGKHADGSGRYLRRDLVVYARLSRFISFGPMLSLISGILSVMCGVMLIANPNVGKWALTILLPIWFIAHCISELTRTNLIRLIGNPFYYYFSLILNILGLVLGFVMIFSPALSFVTLRAICYMVAIYLILFGIESIIAAFARRNSDW